MESLIYFLFPHVDSHSAPKVATSLGPYRCSNSFPFEIKSLLSMKDSVGNFKVVDEMPFEWKKKHEMGQVHQKLDSLKNPTKLFSNYLCKLSFLREKCLIFFCELWVQKPTTLEEDFNFNPASISRSSKKFRKLLLSVLYLGI